MLHALHSEWIKLRRTPATWLTILFPLLCILGLDWYLYASHRLSWNNLLIFVLSFWLALWPAAGVALQAALAAEYDRQERHWQALRVRPIAPEMLFGAKLLMQALHLALHASLISTLILLSGLLLHAQGIMPPVHLLFFVALACTFLTLPLQVLYTWIATAYGIGVAIAIGGVGLLLDVLIGSTSMGDRIWLFVPWAWPMRLFSLMSTLWVEQQGNRSTPPALAELHWHLIPMLATLILLAVITPLCLRWFKRMEPTNDM